MRDLTSSDADRQAKTKTVGTLPLLALTGLAGAGGWLVYSATMIDHNLPLPLAIDGERLMFSSAIAGLMNYYADDSSDGRPLLLIHSINAAASAYEMRPIFEHYQGRRAVYAIDLPGYGFSERSDRYYSPELFIGAIRDFLAEVIGEPADVIALSLSGEFAAQAALERPDLFRSLTVISPTGLSEDAHKVPSKAPIERGGSNGLLNLYRFPLWSQAFFDLLATRVSINYFLKKSFQGAVDEGLANYSFLSAHQPGARHAPLHFISGKLFTRNVLSAVYSKLQRPGLIIYDKDPYTGFKALPDLLLTQPLWSAVRITPTRGLPHFEQMQTLGKVLDNFWQGLEQ